MQTLKEPQDFVFTDSECRVSEIWLDREHALKELKYIQNRNTLFKARTKFCVFLLEFFTVSHEVQNV